MPDDAGRSAGAGGGNSRCPLLLERCMNRNSFSLPPASRYCHCLALEEPNGTPAGAGSRKCSLKVSQPRGVR